MVPVIIIEILDFILPHVPELRIVRIVVNLEGPLRCIYLVIGFKGRKCGWVELLGDLLVVNLILIQLS